VNPLVDETFRQALTLFQAGKTKEAEQAFKKLLRKQPRHVAGLNLLAVLLTQLGRYGEAERYAKLALDENAASDVTFYNYGIILKNLKRPAEALERFDQALAINSTVAETWSNRGVVLGDLKRYADAIGDFDRAIAINPNYADAFYNKGNALAQLRLRDPALGAYERALLLKPNLAKAWCGRGQVLNDLKQYDRAFAAYDKALALNANLAEAWYGRGNLFAELKQYGNAFAAYDTALKIKPDLPYLQGSRLHAKMHLCDWRDLDADIAGVLSAIRKGRPAAVPFSILSIPATAADQRKCAEAYIADKFPSILSKEERREIRTHERIRVAYFSSDFNEHATGHLTAGLFEHHDRSRFEWTAISLGPPRPSGLNNRIKEAFEHYIDTWPKTPSEIAGLVRELDVDIAVDLNGLTLNSSPDIFAARPAPIQVAYLGYPGTTGAGYFDYILADRLVIPETDTDSYTENVVWLPHSYQVNDSKRPIAEHTPTRSQCGLPETGFVFCCFNNTFKITPDVFAVWMGLLRDVPDSVLWLLDADSRASENLRRHAAASEISPERLVFAPRMTSADHLARHRLADLFLDTLHYNAHTTASDALWVGLPVLTCLGSTFAGRVAASLLHATGLYDLATTSLGDYRALALKLARDPAFLRSVKTRLAQNRDTAALFDTRRFARNIEAAYSTMWERYRTGQPPANFAVDPIGGE
jgi:predicted O-linked N-acetylglucosamine transferase (SPINDLY family)